MGQQRDVEVQGQDPLAGLVMPSGARMKSQTLTTVDIAPIPADQPPVLIAGYDSSDGTLRLANLRTWVEALAKAEKVHMVGKLDARDQIQAAVAAAAAIATLATQTLTVPSGEVWYLNMVELVSPAESGVGVGDLLQVNFRVSSFPDAASTAGQLFFAAAQGTAAIDNFFAEFHAAAPWLAEENFSEPLRLVGGDILTLVATLAGAVAGAALTATLIPHGWKGRLLVD